MRTMLWVIALGCVGIAGCPSSAPPAPTASRLTPYLQDDVQVPNGHDKTVKTVSEQGPGDWKPDKGIPFNGSERIEIPDAPALNPKKFTVETWVRIDARPGNTAMLMNKGGDRTPGSLHLMGSERDFGFTIGVAGQGPGVWHSAPNELKRWYHVAGTYDGKTFRIYVDGKAAGEKEGATEVGNGSPLYLSYNDIGGFEYFLTGALDEIRLWNVVRDEKEIARDMCRKLTGKEKGLVGLWALRSLDGDKLSDLTDNGNHGTRKSGQQPPAPKPKPAFNPDDQF